MSSQFVVSGLLRARARVLRGLARSVLPVLALGTFSTMASADQDVTSSDGAWKLHVKVEDSFKVKSSGQAIVDITPAAGGKGCPSVSSVVFEMPAHGHGGGKEPESMTMGSCTVHVSGLMPTMDGSWRLRLVPPVPQRQPADGGLRARHARHRRGRDPVHVVSTRCHQRRLCLRGGQLSREGRIIRSSDGAGGLRQILHT